LELHFEEPVATHAPKLAVLEADVVAT
jgi:hypothetical protein